MAFDQVSKFSEESSNEEFAVKIHSDDNENPNLIQLSDVAADSLLLQQLLLFFLIKLTST